ncbi:MAG: hypothetical protein HY673_05565 [Chloroflexi bacterium]|nr:hypothetical protein [Chloroflexota bacterium]
MSETTFGIEAMEMALHLEKIGRSFYEHMAGVGNGAGGLYRDLASQETEHEKVLAYALDHLDATQRAAVYPWDYYQYIKSVADRVVSLDGLIQEAVAQGSVSAEKAAGICQALERESIFVYSTMYSLVPIASKDICQKLAEAETLHLIELQKMAQTGLAVAQSMDKTTVELGPPLIPAGNLP